MDRCIEHIPRVRSELTHCRAWMQKCSEKINLELLNQEGEMEVDSQSLVERHSRDRAKGRLIIIERHKGWVMKAIDSLDASMRRWDQNLSVLP